ncbi:MAG: hypothetical protein AAF378_04760 [Cyanobacteria bacterium P01_A01_bin.84]
MNIKLGFGQIPKPQYIFVGRENDYCWYTLVDDQKIPIYEKALTGIIKNIELNRKVDTSFGEAEKTDLHILADKPYVVRSGSDSYFSKGLLLSLDALSVEQLRQPLTVVVEPGDKKVVFCQIYNPITYRSVEVSWNEYKVIDWVRLGQRVNFKIDKAAEDRFTQATNRYLISEERKNSGEGRNSGERKSLIAQTDFYLTQLKWSQKQGRELLQQKYGKRSRQQLSDTELLDFIDYLRLQPQIS